MFGLYFADYLVKNDLITGAIPEEMLHLSYAPFVEALVNMGGMPAEDIDKHILAFQSDSHLTDDELEALQSGELDRIIPVFIHFDSSDEVEKNLIAYQVDNNLTNEELENVIQKGEIQHFMPGYIWDDPAVANRFVRVALKTLLHFTKNRTMIKKSYSVPEYAFHSFAFQRLKGAHTMIIGFSGEGDNMLAIANAYGGKTFDKMDDDAFGCVCELINCISGLYASEMSDDGVELEMDCPDFYTGRKLVSNGPIVCIPLLTGNLEVELVVSIDTNIEVV